MRSSLRTGAAQREPGEEADREDEHDDRHVVGLGNDVAEVGVRHGPAGAKQTDIEDGPGDRRQCQVTPEHEHEYEADRGGNKEALGPDRPVHPIADVLGKDPTAQVQEICEGVKEENAGNRGPQHGEVELFRGEEVIGGKAEIQQAL